jgi:hypothetical protein
VSFTILEASFTVIYGVYITGVTYDDYYCMFIILYFQEPERVEHMKGASLGLEPALFTNITLGWKSLPRTNTLAYWANS